MADLTKETIEELRGLLAKATPGPWSIHPVDDTTIISPAREVATTCDSAQTEREDGYNIEYEQMQVDAAFIVAMRNALPALLDLATASLAIGSEDGAEAAYLAKTIRNWEHVGPRLCEKAANKLDAQAGRIRALAAENEALRIGDADTRRAIGDRFCLVPPDGGDVKTWEAAAALRAENERLRKALADDLRAGGWAVAVHNDYRLNGEAHTFWLFTKDGRAIKGEGLSDAEALDEVRRARSELEAGHE